MDFVAVRLSESRPRVELKPQKTLQPCSPCLRLCRQSGSWHSLYPSDSIKVFTDPRVNGAYLSLWCRYLIWCSIIIGPRNFLSFHPAQCNSVTLDLFYSSNATGSAPHDPNNNKLDTQIFTCQRVPTSKRIPHDCKYASSDIQIRESEVESPERELLRSQTCPENIPPPCSPCVKGFPSPAPLVFTPCKIPEAAEILRNVKVPPSTAEGSVIKCLNCDGHMGASHQCEDSSSPKETVVQRSRTIKNLQKFCSGCDIFYKYATDHQCETGDGKPERVKRWTRLSQWTVCQVAWIPFAHRF